MRKHLFIATALAATLAAGSAVAFADPFDSGPGDPETAMDGELLNEKLEALRKAGAPAVVAEVRDGDSVWEGATGSRVLGDPTPPEPTDRVRVASLTKSMIVTATLQLVDEGELDLDASIQELLPDVLPYEDTITVRQLLGHTSGIPDYFVHIYGSLHDGDPSDVRTNRLLEFTPQDIIAKATEDPLLFEPGSDYGYSNTGYTVIGLLIEELTGRSLEDVLAERVLRPTGMDDTYLPERDQLVVDGPHPNAYFDAGDGKELIDTSDISPTQFWAGVAAVSNPRDIDRFYRALSDGRLLSPKRLAEARELSPQSDGLYGLGLEGFKTPDGCETVPGGTAYGHGGDGLGYITWSAHSPDGERQVTFSFTLGYELNPTDELSKAVRGLFYAGLCNLDTGRPAVSKAVAALPPIVTQDQTARTPES